MSQENKSEWVPLKDVIEMLHHPDFYWGMMSGLDVKYLELRVDTRGNCCLIRNRNGKPVSLEDMKQALNKVIIKGMNENATENEMINLPEGAAKILADSFEELIK